MTGTLLRMLGIAKRFPGVQALDGVSLEVETAEVHGLLGENGAGKSTLLKILAGALQPDAGTIEFAGAPVTLPTPESAQALGIVTIYQEFNLIPSMTIEENLFLGREPVSGPFVNWADMRRATKALAERYALDLPASRLVRDLSVAQQQMVEIARALSMQSRLIVMDEPTSALSKTETQRLFAVVLDQVSFELRHGEILGVAGLVGSGRTELARCLFGADPKTAGETIIDGKPVDIEVPRTAIAHGIGLVPEDRKQQALFLDLAVRQNLSIAALGKLLRFGFVRLAAER